MRSFKGVSFKASYAICRLLAQQANEHDFQAIGRPGRYEMTRTFTQRVRSAAYAGWCTVIIAAVWLTLAWFGYLVMQHYRPGWILALWGAGTTWEQIHWIMLIFTAVFKVILFTLLMVTIWLTIWGRKLKKIGES